jgi:hypothetical protein
MKEIILELKDIYDAEHINKESLQKVEHDLTQEDFDWYDLNGWKYFHPDNHIEYPLPSLGDPIYLRGSTNPVVEINGKRWKLFFDFDWDHEAYSAKGKRIILRETNEPLSQSERPNPKSRFDYYIKVFGQPVWVQGEHYIAYKGKPCSLLVSIEIGWGDCGNYNILVGCNDEGDPEVAYFEASCC